MSYRKKPYRDKKDEVLAESEKLRKDIENLESALALHTRYQADDRDSVRGLIRQEIGSSRWEYGAEGKLTTFRSGQDLVHESSLLGRTSSRQSLQNKSHQRSSRRTDKTKKNGKAHGSHMSHSHISDTGREDISGRLEASIESIAHLINSGSKISATSKQFDEEKSRKDSPSGNYYTTSKDLSTKEIQSMKKRVLTKASAHVIRRDTLPSSNEIKIKRRSSVITNSPPDVSRIPDNTVREGDKADYQIVLDSPSYEARPEMKDKRASNTSHHQSSSSRPGLKEIKATNIRMPQHPPSAGKEGSDLRRWAQSVDKNTKKKSFSEHHLNNSLSDTQNKNPYPPAKITERPPSPSQNTKSNLLFSLYGDHSCTKDKIPDCKHFDSNLAVKNSLKVQDLDTKPSSRLQVGHKNSDEPRNLSCKDIGAGQNTNLSLPTSYTNNEDKDLAKKGSESSCDPEVIAWLGSLGLQSSDSYASLFAEHQIDMASVLLLTPDSLREMGIQALGPIMKIMKGVHILNRGFNNTSTHHNPNNTSNQLTEESNDQRKKRGGDQFLSHEDQNRLSYGNISSKTPSSVLSESIILGTAPNALSSELKSESPMHVSDLKNASSPGEKRNSHESLHKSTNEAFENTFLNFSDSIEKPDKDSVTKAMLTPAGDGNAQQLVTDVLRETKAVDSSSAQIAWEKSSQQAGFVNPQERGPVEENTGVNKVETVPLIERPSSGRKSRRLIKSKESGSKVTKKPPASSRVADTGISTASQRASARQKKLQQTEQAAQEAIAQQKIRRDEMAAKHVQRRSSSAERTKGSGLFQTSHRPNLHRSASFTENRNTQHKSSKAAAQPSKLEGVLTGRGLDLKHSTSKTPSGTVDKIEDIIAALQDIPTDEAASSLTSKTRQSRPKSRSRSPGSHVEVTLGAVRELQTRLSCLEEQLTGQTSSVAEEPLIIDACSDDLKRQTTISQSHRPDSGLGKDYETLPKEGQNYKVPKSTKEQENQRPNGDYPSEQLTPASLYQAEMPQLLDESKAIYTKPFTSADSPEQCVRLSSPLSARETSSSYNVTASVSQAPSAVSTFFPDNVDISCKPAAKQGKGHYYRIRKGGFNFQAVPRPPEMGVIYNSKESCKPVELSKDDISFSEDDLCGEGAFSQVFRGIYKGSEVAVKRLKTSLLPRDKNYFIAEISMMRELRHPRVVMLMGVCDTDSFPLVVLEYMASGNLHSLLHSRCSSALSDVEFYQICHDISSGLLYLHNHQPPVLHLDLKPRNVLLSHGNRAKVADFGFSKLKHEADMKVSRLSKSRLLHTAPSWMAPELLVAREITAKADVYSFGILMWEMFTREMPYADCTVFQILEHVRLNKRPTVPDACPQGLTKLIHQCWSQNPAARPNFKHIIKTVEQLAETDTWPDPPNGICNATNSSEGVDSMPDPHDNRAKAKSPPQEIPQKEKEIPIEDPEIQTMSENAVFEMGRNDIASSNVRLSSNIIRCDNDEEYISTPKSTILELETKAGHTTLFVYGVPQQSPAQDKKHDDFLQTCPQSVPAQLVESESFPSKDRNVSSLTAKESPNLMHCPPSLSAETSSIQDNQRKESFPNLTHGNSVGFPSDLSLHSDSNKSLHSGDIPLSPPSCQDDEQTARDLIAKYLLPKKYTPSMSRSFEQHSSSRPPKKLLPLRHSLDKPKPQTADVNRQEVNTGHLEILDTNTAGAEGGEKSVSPKERPASSHEQRVLQKSPNKLGGLRKSIYPPYADGQPYVPLFYDEIQQAKSGKRRAKIENFLCGAESKREKRKTDDARPIPRAETSISEKDLAADDWEAQSEFMISLNKSAVVIAGEKLQEQSVASKKSDSNKQGKQQELYLEDNTSFKTTIIPGSEKENSLDKNPHLSTFAQKKTEHFSAGHKSNGKQWKNESKGGEGDGFLYNVQKKTNLNCQSICTDLNDKSKESNADSLTAQSLIFAQSTKTDEGTYCEEKPTRQSQTLILNLQLPETGDDTIGVDESDSRSETVLSQASSSTSPDGISVDSLSLSQDGDTVVDSLELPDSLSSDDAQDSGQKEVPKALPVKQPLGLPLVTPTASTTEKPHIETRQSFFLFDEAETNEPFDILKSATVQYTMSAKNVNHPDQSVSKRSNQLSLSRSSNARQRARQRRVREIAEKAENTKSHENVSKPIDTENKQNVSPQFDNVPASGHDKATRQRQPEVLNDAARDLGATLASQTLPPRLSLTGNLLAQGKQLLRPAASRCKKSSDAMDSDKPHLDTKQNLPRFSVDANLLQLQKGQLRSVQAEVSSPSRSTAHTVLPVNEEGLPSMANILKKALDERRFAMGDNPESQDYTPGASWSLQDEDA